MRPEEKTRRIQRGELVVLGLILAVAIVLRCAWPTRLAVEHFDEGVYASDVWYGIGPGQSYPFRFLYAPPLVPLITEGSLLFSGMAPSAPIWAGIVAGLLTIPSLWWIGRCWWGAAAGLMVAALAATSDVHAVFSRSALTEPWLLLWFVWAVFFLERALRTGTWLNIGAAGVLTGVAWWTKYNGWLPLAVAAGGVLLIWLRDDLEWRRLYRAVRAWFWSTALALIVWAPVVYGIRDDGGYAAVAGNHRRYVVGFAGWLDSISSHMGNFRLLESGFSLVAGPLLLLMIMLTVTSLGGTRGRLPGFRVGLAMAALIAAIAAGALLLNMPAALGLLTAGMMIREVVIRWRNRDEGASNDELGDAKPLATAMLAAWFAGLLAVTPLYYPYTRLTLPWLASAWLGAAWALTRLADEFALRGEQHLLPRWFAGGVLLLIVVMLIGGGAWHYDRVVRQVPAWEDRGGLRRAALRLAAAARRDEESRNPRRGGPPSLILDVLGEPAVFYHLQTHLYAAGWPLSVPVADLATVMEDPRSSEQSVYIIAGPHALQDRSFLRESERFEIDSAHVATEPFVPSTFLQLDHRDTRQPSERPNWELRMFRSR